MTKPLFVAISDIHFNVNNLEIATTALKLALWKAKELEVPLIIAGDLHDTKAIIRGEVANRLLEIFYDSEVQTYILVGNHDLLNEKGKDNGLNYLNVRNVFVVSHATSVFCPKQIYLVPYQNTPEAFKDALQSIPKGSIVVAHQGVKGAFMGDYVQDKTSIDPSELEGYRIFSGHYHKHQTIGSLTYLGSPFTHTFGEANDGPKGFLVVNEDGSYEQIVLNLRKHVIIDIDVSDTDTSLKGLNQDDLVWLKIRGPESELAKVDKNYLGNMMLGHSNYKLDLIVSQKDTIICDKEDTLSSIEIFDKLIDEINETDQQKDYLKSLWKEMLS